MCCRKQRALRQQQMNQCGNPLLANPHMNGPHRGGIDSLVGAVGNLAINARPTPAQVPSEMPAQESMYSTQYLRKLDQIDPPPSYDVASNQTTPDIVSREMSHSTSNVTKIQPSSTKSVQLPAQFQSNSPQISKLLEGLTAAIAAHQSGFGRQRSIRKAEKALRNQLYEDEIARRESMHGKLRCGERSEIWRNIKVIDLAS